MNQADAAPADRDLLAVAVEAAAARAWPAVEETGLDGWTLRLSEGYTRRANCITASGSPALSLEQAVARCEAVYAGSGRPAVFRLPEPWAPTGLDALLERRGYARAGATRVLVRRIGDTATAAPAHPVHLTGDAVRWRALYEAVTGAPDGERPAHLRILRKGTGEHLYAGVGVPDEPMACGVGVADGAYLGLFDIAVRPDARRRGIGSALVGAILDAGAARGAVWAYLQVTEANTAAAALYASLGFSDLYRYWYRQPPA